MQERSVSRSVRFVPDSMKLATDQRALRPNSRRYRRIRLRSAAPLLVRFHACRLREPMILSLLPAIARWHRPTRPAMYSRCGAPSHGPTRKDDALCSRGKKENVPRKRASLSRTGLRWYLHPLPSACGYQKQAARGLSECWRETAPDPSESAGSGGRRTARVATVANLSRWDGPSCARDSPSRVSFPMIRLTFAKLKPLTRCPSPATDCTSEVRCLHTVIRDDISGSRFPTSWCIRGVSRGNNKRLSPLTNCHWPPLLVPPESRPL